MILTKVVYFNHYEKKSQSELVLNTVCVKGLVAFLLYIIPADVCTDMSADSINTLMEIAQVR